MIKKHLNKFKVVATTGVITAMTAVQTFAATPPAGTADTAVTGAFADAAADIGATIAIVAAGAVTLWLIPQGFRFAKKIFKTVSN